MDHESTEALGELSRKLDLIAEQVKQTMDRTDAVADQIADIHRAWCVEIERERRTLPDRPRVAVGPGDRVSWTDPKDASNVAWGGTVEFVGADRKGTLIAHVDFAGYGRRNLPVDQLIVGIIT